MNADNADSDLRHPRSSAANVFSGTACAQEMTGTTRNRRNRWPCPRRLHPLSAACRCAS